MKPITTKNPQMAILRFQQNQKSSHEFTYSTEHLLTEQTRGQKKLPKIQYHNYLLSGQQTFLYETIRLKTQSSNSKARESIKELDRKYMEKNNKNSQHPFRHHYFHKQRKKNCISLIEINKQKQVNCHEPFKPISSKIHKKKSSIEQKIIDLPKIKAVEKIKLKPKPLLRIHIPKGQKKSNAKINSILFESIREQSEKDVKGWTNQLNDEKQYDIDQAN